MLLLRYQLYQLISHIETIFNRLVAFISQESLLPLANRTSDLLSVPGIYEKVLEECNQTEAIKMEQYIANKYRNMQLL